VDVDVGYDRVVALAIADRCEAEGSRVSLRLTDANGLAPRPMALTPHRLAVAEQGVDAVREIVAKFERPQLRAERDRRRSRLVLAVGFVLLVLIGFSWGLEILN
jgi:hypothetical protein